MYQAEVSRTNPSCFLFLLDQSASMADPFGVGESNQSKADGVADSINRLLQNLVLKCAREEGVRDYYHVGVIGYGAQTGPAFGGGLAGRNLVPLSEVADNPIRIEERTKKVTDGAGGLLDQQVKFPVWFEPTAQGGTPMCQALASATSTIGGWLNEHPDCFPPIVINVTDGEATDGDPQIPAKALTDQRGSDGEVLLFNLHLSSQTLTPIIFPGSEEGLPDDFARLLFNMSSPLPAHLKTAAQQDGIAVSEGMRGFVFNADMVAVIRFLDIGTRPSNLR